MSRLIVHTAIKDPVAQLEKAKGRIHRLLFLATANPTDTQSILIHYLEAGENTIKGFSIQRKEGKTPEQSIMDEFLRRHVINSYLHEQSESESTVLSQFIGEHQLEVDPLLVMAREASPGSPGFLSKTASFASDRASTASDKKSPTSPSTALPSREVGIATPLIPKTPSKTVAFFDGKSSKKPDKSDGCPVTCAMC